MSLLTSQEVSQNQHSVPTTKTVLPGAWIEDRYAMERKGGRWVDGWVNGRRYRHRDLWVDKWMDGGRRER